jgi:WD40 repeat protein
LSVVRRLLLFVVAAGAAAPAPAARPCAPAEYARPRRVAARPRGRRPPSPSPRFFPPHQAFCRVLTLCSIRTGSSQDVSHKTGLDISALDINRDRTHAILAGKEILKTVRVHDAKIVEDTNLRAAVINYAEHTTPARQREGLGIHDVKWSHGQFGTHIATAAANGKVILYDLNRAGVELARLHEHTRQVHKLAFNPHQGHLLLSASHDATVRLWDLRDMRKEIMTCPSRDQYHGINGGIRDVQWSPTDAVEFAFGTDNGTIQRWDFLYNKGPKQKITAHDQRICTSIDWHPDGKHLLSAGVDKTVKVWDFSVDGRRQKPAFVLTTPYPVYRAKWRPPCWSDEYYEKGVYECTQIAASYDRDHPIIHIWDYRRPYLPFREINKFSSAPSDMLWHSRDTLWTVGREGVFQQNDVHLAPKVVDRRNLQAFAVSPSGEIGGITQKRARRRRSGLDYSTDDTYMGEKRSSPEKNSLRSSADDSLDDSFLSSSSRRHHGRTASNRSAKSFGGTPPSEPAPKVMYLTDSMALHSELARPNQIAFRGTIPGAANVQIFAYLAQKYKAIPLPDPPTLQSFVDLQQVFDQNAEYAQRAAFYRLAETWRIVGTSISVATRRRAELHRERRRMHQKPAEAPSSDAKPQIASEPLTALDKQLTVRNPAVRAILGPFDKPQPPQGANQPPPVIESTSNLATPLARPLTTSSQITTDAHQLPQLPDPDGDETIIDLPPAVTGPHSSGQELPHPTAPANQSHISSHPSFSGIQWYNSPNDLDERRAMIGSWRAPPRAPLSLEPTNAQGINIKIPPRLDRHDSDESFAMFSASTDSQQGNSMPSSFASGQSRDMEPLLENQQHVPADSSFGKPRLVEAASAVKPRAVEGDSLDKSVQVSPTTIPIGQNGTRAALTSDRGVQQGSAREGTGHAVEFSSREQAVLDMHNLRRNNQLLRHDSSESEAFTNSTGGISASSMDYNIDMEASGTIIPDYHEDMRSPEVQKPPTLPHVTESAPPVLEPTAEHSLLLSDYQAMHVDAEQGSAFAVIGLLKNILAFYTSALSDAQTSSLLLLLLAPLLPRTQDLSETSEFDAAEILSSFSETLTALGLTPTQAQTVLSTQLTEVLTTGINPYQAESILHTYHAQLHSLSLFNSAASLRRLAYPTYPAVYEQALKDTQLGLLCLSCKSPINNPKDKMRCETCKRAQAPCPICWGRYPAFEPVASKKKAKAKIRSSLRDKEHRRKRSSLLTGLPLAEKDNAIDTPSPTVSENITPPKATLWTWCPLCGHGGHMNCLSTWFADPALSEGTCATEGCLCDCVSGRRREEKIAEVLAKKAEKERARVVRKGDDWKVNESKAVSAVRGTIGEARDATEPQTRVQNPNAVASGLLPGRREDGKRVRVVAHDERQQGQLPTTSSQYPPHTTTFGKLPK